MNGRIETLKIVSEKEPDNLLELYRPAVELFKEKRYDKTILYLHKYIDIHEDEGTAYRLLVQSYLNIGGIEKAIDYHRIEQAKRFSQEIQSLKGTQ